MAALNPWDISERQRMPIGDESSQVYSMPPVVDAVETERLVEALRVFPIQVLSPMSSITASILIISYIKH